MWSYAWSCSMSSLALESRWCVSGFMSSLSSAYTSLGMGEKDAFLSSHILSRGGGGSKGWGGGGREDPHADLN